MLRLNPLRIERPETVSAAVELLGGNPDARVIAGGTDLVPKLKRGQMQTGTLVAIDRIAGLDEMETSGGLLHIGARVRLADLACCEYTRPFTALLQAASRVATPIIRVRATIAGNVLQDTRCRYYDRGDFWREATGHCLKLDGDTCRVAHGGDRCHATYCSDVAPALAVLGAHAILAIAGRKETKSVPIAELYRDDGIEAVDIGRSLVTGFTLPLDAPPSTYRKLRLRESFDFPEVGVAASARPGETGAEILIAVSGVASALVVHSDRIANGQPADPVADTVFQRVRPMDTMFFPPAYRKKMTRRLVLGSLHDLGIASTDRE